jgi:hypothetical protein
MSSLLVVFSIKTPVADLRSPGGCLSGTVNPFHEQARQAAPDRSPVQVAQTRVGDTIRIPALEKYIVESIKHITGDTGE